MLSNRGHIELDRSLRKGALIILLVVLAIGLWSPPVHAAKQSINKVDISTLPDSVQIKVTASAPLALHHDRIGARYIIFDLYGTLAGTERRRVSINSGGIRFVNCAWYKNSPPIARIAVAADGTAQYSVKYADGKRIAILTVYKLGHSRSGSQTAIEATKQVGSVPMPKAFPLAAVEPEVASRLAEMSSMPAQTSEPAPAATESPVAAQPAVVSEPVPAPAQPPAVPTPVVVTKPAAILHVAPKPVTRTKPVLVASALTTLPESEPEPKLVSLDFVGSDIHDVLKALSTQGGVNIVASADVKGDVTASLNGVSVDEALKLVASLSGYRYEWKDGAYLVGTAENLKALSASEAPAEGSATQAVIVTYSDPVLITKMLGAQYGMVNITSSASDPKQPAKGQTILVLSGPASSVQSASTMVQAIEDSVAGSTAEFVTDLYEVKYADIADLQLLLSTVMKGVLVTVGPNEGFKLECPTAVAMGSTSSPTMSASTQGTPQTAPPKMLILQGSQADVDKAKELLAKLDVPRQQILIEAKVVDIKDDASKDLGILWGDQGIISKPILSEAAQSNALHIGSFGRTGISVTAQINALIEDSKAKVLANPNVLALDGKPSSVFVGDEVKYVINITASSNGTTVTTDTARVGVQLHTISRVSSDGYITMDLHPEVSVITSFLETGGLSLPQVSRRFVDTTVRVKDGETIVIGGLIKDDDLKTISGIPILKDLPLIGELFKNRSTSKVHSEVMMFITPRVVKGS